MRSREGLGVSVSGFSLSVLVVHVGVSASVTHCWIVVRGGSSSSLAPGLLLIGCCWCGVT